MTTFVAKKAKCVMKTHKFPSCVSVCMRRTMDKEKKRKFVNFFYCEMDETQREFRCLHI